MPGPDPAVIGVLGPLVPLDDEAVLDRAFRRSITEPEMSASETDTPIGATGRRIKLPFLSEMTSVSRDVSGALSDDVAWEGKADDPEGALGGGMLGMPAAADGGVGIAEPAVPGGARAKAKRDLGLSCLRAADTLASSSCNCCVLA